MGICYVRRVCKILHVNYISRGLLARVPDRRVGERVVNMMPLDLVVAHSPANGRLRLRRERRMHIVFACRDLLSFGSGPLVRASTVFTCSLSLFLSYCFRGLPHHGRFVVRSSLQRGVCKGPFVLLRGKNGVEL